jgi:hypothetical protein
MQGPVAAAIPNWQASVSFINRSPGPRLSESGSGQSRQTSAAKGFAGCPLCLQYRPNWCVTAKRRFVPFATERSAAKSRYSITSSARASSVGGMSMPRDFAVLRLMINSYFDACSTGRSAGLAPFRILST